MFHWGGWFYCLPFPLIPCLFLLMQKFQNSVVIIHGRGRARMDWDKGLNVVSVYVSKRRREVNLRGFVANPFVFGALETALLMLLK